MSTFRRSRELTVEENILFYKIEYSIDFSATNNKIDNVSIIIKRIRVYILLYLCGAMGLFLYIMNRTKHGCLEV